MFVQAFILNYLASRWPFGTFICSPCICVSKICPTVMCDSCRAFAANCSAARQPHYTVCGLSSVGPRPPATSHTTAATTQHLPPSRQPPDQDVLSVAAARVRQWFNNGTLAGWTYGYCCWESKATKPLPTSQTTFKMAAGTHFSFGHRCIKTYTVVR